MRSVNSAFWLGLQQDAVNLTELIDLTTTLGVYHWTTSNVPLVVGADEYLPFPGQSADGAEESTDLGIGTISFSMVNTGNIRELLNANGLDNAPVAISRVFTNSPDLGRLYLFRGKLGDLAYDRMAVSGQARNIFNGVAGRFPYYTYQDTCVWRFGSPGCKVEVDAYTITGALSVASSSPIVLVAAGGTLPSSAGWFDRGRVTITSGTNSGQVRTVRSHVGDSLILSHALPFVISSGTNFSLWPGCRKRLDEDCIAKYGNQANFFGFKWIPRTENAF